jgi:integrase
MGPCSATSTAAPLIPRGPSAASPTRSPRLPATRLHDLRNTRATLLLADGAPAKVVSERFGHTAQRSPILYRPVRPRMGREAAGRAAALIEG